MQKRKRGRQPPDYGMYICTGCITDKPTIRHGTHVACKCGSPPNPSLAKLMELPDWPRVIRGV